MLDGTRPDALREANAPVIHRLADEGVRYLQATTIYPSQTRVAFVSLSTGAYPEKHGIVGGDEIKDALWRTISMGNDDPVAAQALVTCSTFFEEATAAGLTSLYAAMKGYELVGARGATWTIDGKRTLSRVAYPTRYLSDVFGSSELAAGYKDLLSRELLDQALEIVRSRRPNLVVINLGSADYAAHSFGPSSPRYRSAIEYVDSLVGDLLRALDSLGIRDRSAMILSADHGFSEVDASRLVAPVSADGGHTLPALANAGIEHFVVNTGGASMGIYVRDKGRAAEAVSLLRREPWCESVYCEDGRAGCDRTLRGLRSYFPGRSPDLMVDLDDDAALNNAPGAARESQGVRHENPVDPVRCRRRPRTGLRQGKPRGRSADGAPAARTALPAAAGRRTSPRRRARSPSLTSRRMTPC
jgi:predicted AlkP superfamily pyrophosphatase or phosphodiesterase